MSARQANTAVRMFPLFWATVFWAAASCAFLLLAPAANAQDRTPHRGGVNWKAPDNGLDLTVGRMVGGDQDRVALGMTARRYLKTIRGTAIALTLTSIFAPEAGPAPFSLNCSAHCPVNCPDSEAFRGVREEDLETGSEGVRDEDLETGSSVWLFPGVEWTFCRRCSRPSVSVGLGMRHNQGRQVTLGDRTFAVDDQTNAVLSLGTAWHKELSYGLLLRAELRLLHNLGGKARVTAPGGVEARPDIDRRTVGFVSVGFQRRF